MSEDTIYFQQIPGDNSEGEKIRNVFRTPVSLTDDIRINFGENEYLVHNLSETGIAVNVSSCLEFDSGQIIDGAQLRIGDVNVTGLSGKVIYCSMHDSGSYQLGFQWVDVDAENKKTLKNILGQLKEKALKVKDLFEDHPQS